MIAPEYAAFLDRRAQIGTEDGFDPTWMPEFLFDFQAALVEWSLRGGRRAVFADCGLGKTPMQLVWAENVRRHADRPVLIVTPLAVSHQTVREGEKFGVEVTRSDDGTAHPGINVTNYERLHLFDPADFAGTVCDESSAIKAFDGKRRAVVTAFMRKQRYRLLCTATAAPNDYIELGTSSEALGHLGYMDMLGRFFKNDQNNTVKPVRRWAKSGQGATGSSHAHREKWRFKGHAEDGFWRWVASWARAMRRPSDLGFDDARFVLPALIEREHLVENATPRPDMLFDLPAIGLHEQREEQRRTIGERCEVVADIVSKRDDCSIVWCNLNDEGDTLERLIPNSIQVSGSDPDEWKVEAVQWFQGHKCICNDPLFRAKLTAWNQNSHISNSTIDAIAKSELLRQRNTNASTPKSGGNTCTPTTSPTPTSSPSEHPNNGMPTTPPAESAIRQTPNSEISANATPGSGTPPTPISGSPKSSGNTESPLTTTTGCLTNKAEGAPSATPTTPETSAGIDSTSTTATIPDTFGDSSARVATLLSASSKTTPTDWSAPHCTCGHASGKRVLIAKARMFGYGLNLQHCDHMTFFPSHSYEQYYQGVRRCWRFGQQNPVTVDVVTTPGGHDVMANLQRKAAQADEMFTRLVAHMNDAMTVERQNKYTEKTEVPAWM